MIQTLRSTFLLTVLISLNMVGITAQNKASFVSSNPFQTNCFIENKGQFETLEGVGNTQFAVEHGGLNAYFNKEGVVYKIYETVPIVQKHHKHRKEKKEEEEEATDRIELSLLKMRWVGANQNVQIVANDKSKHYFTYGAENLNSYGYQSITYRNLYNGIDVTYSMPKDGGVEYTLHVHPGADLSQVKAYYYGDRGAVSMDSGKIKVMNQVDYLTEDAPVASYQAGGVVACNFTLNNDTIGFALPAGYDHTKDLIIDPWVSPITTMSSSGLSSNRGLQVDFDNAGNLYVYGGGSHSSSGDFKVAKYDTFGVIQWTFSGFIASIPWHSNGNSSTSERRAGNFVIDKATGKTYIVQGILYTGVTIARLTTGGVYDNFVTTAIPAFDEGWNLFYNCFIGDLLITGGNNTTNESVAKVNLTTGTLTRSSVTGSAVNSQDIVCSTFDTKGNTFAIFADFNNPANIDNYIYRINAAYNGYIWRNPSGYTSFSESGNEPYFFGVYPNSNAFNALAANDSLLFYYDGKFVKAFNTTTGAPVGSAYTVAGQTILNQGGIVVDLCGNVYVGGNNGNIKVLSFNGSTFTAQPDITIAGETGKAIYDLGLDRTQGKIFVSGDGFVSVQSTSIVCTHITIEDSIHLVCPNTAIATSYSADSFTSSNYTWIDSATGSTVRSNLNSPYRTDTLTNLIAGKTYAFRVTKTNKCGSVNDNIYFKIPPVNSTQTITICSGQSYHIGTHTYTVANTYIDTLLGHTLCDSIVTTILQVSSAVNARKHVYLCPGNSYTVNGHTYTLPGVYTDTLHHAGVCDTILVDTISVGPQTPFNHTLSSVPSSCTVNNTGIAIVNESGGTSPYTFHWTGSPSVRDSATGLATGTYFVTITDNQGCTDTAHVNVGISGTIPLIISPVVNVACFGGNTGSATAVLRGGTAPFHYAWSPSGGTGLTASGLSATTYRFVVTDTNGCTGTNSVNITQNSQLQHTFTSTQTNCNQSNGSVTINETGGKGHYTYSWTGYSGRTADSLSSIPAGIYHVVVTDSLGCIDSAALTVNNSSGPSANITTHTNVRCFGQSNGSATATVTGGTGLLTFGWSPSGGTGLTASNLAQGTYTFSVSDANNCIATAQITITQPNRLQHTTSSTPSSCANNALGTATVNEVGGTIGNGYTYSWSPSGGTASTASLLPTGNYVVSVTDSSGCSDTAHIFVPITGTLPTNINPVNVLCFGDSTGSATAVVTGGTTPFNYSWSPRGGANLTAVRLSQGIYTFSVSDNNGCTGTANVTIIQPAQPLSHTVQITPAGCGATNGSATITEAGGTVGLGYTFQWTPTGGNAATANGLAQGNYVVSVTDSAGCKDTAHVAITTAGGLATSIPIFNEVSCFGGNDGSATAAVVGGTAPFIYTWSPAGSTGLKDSNLIAGQYIFSVSDHNGCTGTATINITQPNAPLNVTTTITPATCGASNGSVVATPTGGTNPYKFLWSNGVKIDSIHLLAGSTNYLYTVTDNNGCSTANSAFVRQFPAMRFSLTTLDDTCYLTKGKVWVNILSGTAPFNYVWSYNTALNQDTIYPIIGNINYHVTVTDSIGCTDTARFDINSFGISPTPSLGNDTFICTGIITLYPGHYPAYLWKDNSTDSTLKVTAPGAYSVQVTDTLGCKGTAKVTVLYECNSYIYHPTAFTPNGDGHNDFFHPIYSPDLEKYHLHVYDRWGQQVFESTDYKIGWDGTFKGSSQPLETYVWYATYNFVAGEVKVAAGNVTLIR